MFFQGGLRAAFFLYSGFKSVGLGDDCRYDLPRFMGTVLEVEENCVHLAFFKNGRTAPRRREPRETMSSISRRRDFMANNVPAPKCEEQGLFPTNNTDGRRL